MNSTLKIALPLALVVIVIFGVTLISQNVGEIPPEDELVDTNTNKITGPPLVISATAIGYNPAAPDIESRSFQGFYELDKTAIPISFWFQNIQPVPVNIQALQRGCTSCTQARIGVVDQKSFDKFVERAVIGALPANPLAAMNLIPALAAAELTTEIQWQDFDFDNMDKTLKVPAGSPERPVMGLFQMAISVTSVGPSDKRYVAVRAWPEGGTPSDYAFAANMIGVQPFEPLEQNIKVPTMNVGAESKTYDVFVLSATRKLPEDYGSLPIFYPPTITVNPPDPFIQVSSARPLTEQEVASARNQLMANKKTVPLKCGYGFKVTVHRQLSGNTPSEPDIGPFTRTLAINSPGTLHTPTVTVTGVFQGLISLVDGDLIDLKDFPGRIGTTRTVSLVSDNADVEISYLKEESNPNFLEVKLTPPRLENGRRYWDMTVVVPPSRVLRPLDYDSHIVLKATTKAGERRIRLPVKGVGFAR